MYYTHLRMLLPALARVDTVDIPLCVDSIETSVGRLLPGIVSKDCLKKSSRA